MTNNEISELHTLPQWSRRLGVSQKAIRAAIERGDLQAMRLTANGWPRISEDAIRSWLGRCRMGTR